MHKLGGEFELFSDSIMNKVAYLGVLFSCSLLATHKKKENKINMLSWLLPGKNSESQNASTAYTKLGA